MKAEELINILMDYYHVETITELSMKLDVGQPTISKWRKNNSYNLIIKKCKELNIMENINNIYYSKLNTYQEMIVNSIKYRLTEKVLNEFNCFQNEIILLLNCLKENKDITIASRNDLENLIKEYNIKFLYEQVQHLTVEKHRYNLISFLYTFDDLEINYICNNIEEFLNILRHNIKLYNKLLSFDRK